jgi:P pilus assembly chaperone PapD
MKYFFSTLIIGMLVTAPFSAFALGLSVSPSRIDMKVAVDATKEQKIIVVNTSDDVALFDVYPDEMARMIGVSPSSFTLEAGEEKAVQLEVSSEDEGIYSTNISVVARALSDSVVSASGGVKVPLTITVGPKNTAQFAGVGGVSFAESFTVGLTAILIILNLAMFLYLQIRKVMKSGS